RDVSGAGPDDDGGGSGVFQHQRGPRSAADQGHSVAVRERRRLVAADQSGRHGNSVERVAARSLGDRVRLPCALDTGRALARFLASTFWEEPRNGVTNGELDSTGRRRLRVVIA